MKDDGGLVSWGGGAERSVEKGVFNSSNGLESRCLAIRLRRAEELGEGRGGASVNDERARREKTGDDTNRRGAARMAVVEGERMKEKE